MRRYDGRSNSHIIFVRICYALQEEHLKAQCPLRVWRKINVFGLQTAHSGFLIYRVLRCITAGSDISKAVQVNWKYSQSKERLEMFRYSASSPLNQPERNGFYKLDRCYVLLQADELLCNTLLTAVCGNHPSFY